MRNGFYVSANDRCLAVNHLARACLFLFGVSLLLCTAQAATEELEEEIVVNALQGNQTTRLLGFTPISGFRFENSLPMQLSASPLVNFVGQGGELQTLALRGLGGQRALLTFEGAPLRPLRRAGTDLWYLPTFAITGEVGPVVGGAAFGSSAAAGTLELRVADTSKTEVGARVESNELRRTLGLAVRRPDISGGIERSASQSGKDSLDVTLNDHARITRAWLSGRSRIFSGEQISSIVLASLRDVGKVNSDFPLRRTDYPEGESALLVSRWEWSRTQATIWGHLNSLDTLIRTSLQRNQVKVTSRDFGFRFSRDLSLNVGDFVLGGESRFRRDYTVRERLSPDQESQPVDSGESTELSVFALFHRSVNENLAIDGGLRWLQLNQDESSHSESSESEWNGHAQLSYRTRSQLLLTLRVGQTSVFPTLDQRFYSGETVRGAVIANPQLQGELVRAVSLGIGRQGEAVDVGMEVQRLKVLDPIERAEAANSMEQFRNGEAGTLYAAGLRVLARIHPNHRLRIDAHYNRFGGSSERELQGIPDDGVAVGWAGRFSRWFDGTIRANWWIGDNNPGPRARATPGRVTIDVGIGLGRSSSLSLFVRNLTNVRYFPSNDSKSRAGRGRSFGVDWRWPGSM